jgi:hypothetical protein
MIILELTNLHVEMVYLSIERHLNEVKSKINGYLDTDVLHKMLCERIELESILSGIQQKIHEKCEARSPFRSVLDSEELLEEEGEHEGW